MTKKTASKEASPSTFTEAEVEKFMKKMDTFYNKLRKEIGEERYDENLSTITTFVQDDKVMTNIRGNLANAGHSVTLVIQTFVETISESTKEKRDVVLLKVLHELGESIRNLWREEKQTITA